MSPPPADLSSMIPSHRENVPARLPSCPGPSHRCIRPARRTVGVKGGSAAEAMLQSIGDGRRRPDQIPKPMPSWRAGDGSIFCSGDAGARVGSIAARCETSRSKAAVGWVLSLV